MTRIGRELTRGVASQVVPPQRTPALDRPRTANVPQPRTRPPNRIETPTPSEAAQDRARFGTPQTDASWSYAPDRVVSQPTPRQARCATLPDADLWQESDQPGSRCATGHGANLVPPMNGSPTVRTAATAAVLNVGALGVLTVLAQAMATGTAPQLIPLDLTAPARDGISSSSPGGTIAQVLEPGQRLVWLRPGVTPPDSRPGPDGATILAPGTQLLARDLRTPQWPGLTCRAPRLHPPGQSPPASGGALAPARHPEATPRPDTTGTAHRGSGQHAAPDPQSRDDLRPAEPSPGRHASGRAAHGGSPGPGRHAVPTGKHRAPSHHPQDRHPHASPIPGQTSSDHAAPRHATSPAGASDHHNAPTHASGHHGGGGHGSGGHGSGGHGSGGHGSGGHGGGGRG